MLFSFQHTTGSWTADPQGSFPSFVAFCSPTLHDKDSIFPIFMDTPEYDTCNLHTGKLRYLKPDKDFFFFFFPHFFFFLFLLVG